MSIHIKGKKTHKLIVVSHGTIAYMWIKIIKIARAFVTSSQVTEQKLHAKWKS